MDPRKTRSLHTINAMNDKQSTIALSSGQSEMLSTLARAFENMELRQLRLPLLTCADTLDPNPLPTQILCCD